MSFPSFSVIAFMPVHKEVDRVEGILAWFQDFKADFILNFIEKDRWLLLVKGLGNTLLMTTYATLIGIAIGIIIALIRSTWDLNSHRMKNPVIKGILCVLNRIGIIYTTVLRGTPMVIQLLILYYVVFAWSSEGLLIASLSFGLNSGAYVSEIFRSGIMSIDKGQFEAGNSLGFNYFQTMWYIIAPQMFKNVLPTLANEFIVLLKETSIAGYATVPDLTFAGNRIRGVTYSAFMPLIAVALIYLALVMILTYFVGKLERRLRQSDNR